MADIPSVFAPRSEAAGGAGPFFLFAHRGYSALAPENTLAAFAAARERGIPGVELDVQLTRDGKIVVFHDEDLGRITGAEGPVGRRSAAELRELDAGLWFDPAFRSEKIPYLDEVFELLRGSVYYDVELKRRGRASDGLEPAVVECLRRHGLGHRCLISSFNPFCIRTVRRLAPGLPTAHIYARHPSVPLLLRRGQARWFVPTPFVKPRSSEVNPINSFVSRRLCRSRIITWTVDDPQQAARLVHLGARGFISNHPGRIRAALPELVR